MTRSDSAELNMTLCYLRRLRLRFPPVANQCVRYPLGFRFTAPWEVSDG